MGAQNSTNLNLMDIVSPGWTDVENGLLSDSIPVCSRRPWRKRSMVVYCDYAQAITKNNIGPLVDHDNRVCPNNTLALGWFFEPPLAAAPR